MVPELQTRELSNLETKYSKGELIFIFQTLRIKKKKAFGGAS